MRRRLAVRVVAVTLVALAAVAGAALLRARGADEPLPPAAELEAHRLEVEGQPFSIVRGAAYRLDVAKGTWSFFRRLYDPDFLAKHYEVEGSRVYRRSPETGRRHEVSRRFTADFEGASTLADLVGERFGWTGVTLQSPRAKTVPDYVRLRQRILAGASDFLDNRVEPSGAEFHGGARSLRTLSVAPTADMVCAKASLETELLHFRRGDDFWFAGSYLVKGARPLTLMDLESTWIDQHPGMRIFCGDDGLTFELKWGAKPRWRPKTPVLFPLGRWVRVVAHVRLSERDGEVSLWQDGVLVTEGRGQTLPLADTIYNSLEVGISATGVASEVFVDDVEVSDRPLR